MVNAMRWWKSIIGLIYFKILYFAGWVLFILYKKKINLSLKKYSYIVSIMTENLIYSQNI